MSIKKTAIVLLALSSAAYAGEADKYPDYIANLQALSKETLAAKYVVRWCPGENVKLNENAMRRKWTIPSMLPKDEFDQIVEASMVETRKKLDEKSSQYGVEVVCKAAVEALQSGPENDWPIVKSN